MSIDKAIALGEQKAKEIEAKKLADEQAKLTDEQKKAAQEEEAKAKREADDAKLMEEKEDTLSDEQKARKAEILKSAEVREAAEKKRILETKDEDLSQEERNQKTQYTIEKKEAEREARIQARFDELTGKLKAEESYRIKDQEEIARLKAELEKVKAGEGTTEVHLEKLEEKRREKYLVEDKSLPREKRREMDDAELEEWMVEDMVAANRWLAKQEYRRDKERQADEAKIKEGDVDQTMKQKAELVIRKQAESKARVAAKHPELNIESRIAELKKQGKSDTEVQTIIFKENPKARIVADILREDADKYILSEDGPELLAQEMEKRLKGNKSESQDERDERIRQEAIEAERRRIASLPEHLRSNRNGEPDAKLSDLEKDQFAVYKKAFPHKTFADFQALQKKRAEIHG